MSREMNIIHLYWIVPLCVSMGIVINALCSKAADNESEKEKRTDEWVSILDRYPTKEDADKNGKVVVYGMRHNDFSDKHVYLADWDDTSVYPCVSTHWIRVPKKRNDNVVVTVTKEQNMNEMIGTVTIIGTDIEGNERTETINVPGQSKGVYVSLKGKDEPT